ncbi:MAG: DUF2905 domain-containing protein [Syntrophales bacterium]|jgi:hypothetical protein|nr:DUF2905 domain-containing protein [Syntrophales bacterium]MDY0043436.1 DUF2905 domain-containing protein [Syntrophales bacterium]
MNLVPLGKILIVTGLIIIFFGALLAFTGRFPSWIGQLPGDIHLKGKYGTFYFPIVTSLIISVIVSFLIYIFKGR